MATTRRQYGSPYPYDCIISGVGCMLEPMPNGEPSWIERSVEFFQGDVQLSAEDRGYVQFPPTVELPFAWTDLSEGAGISEQGQGSRFRRRYHYALNADCSTGRPIMGPKMTDQGSLTVTSGARPHQVVEFNGKLWLIVGDKIFERIDDTSITGGGSGGGWQAVSVPGAFSGLTIGKCAAFRGTQSAAYLFVPIGSSANYYVMDTAKTFTQHASRTADHFEVLGDALWMSATESNQQVIRKCEDGGTAATWLGPTYIGDGSKTITWLQADQDRLMILKEDGIFSPTDGEAIDMDLTPQLRPLSSTANGKRAISWGGNLISTYGQMLWKFNPDTGVLEQFGPETLEQNASEVKGPIRAWAGHGNQALYAAAYNINNASSYLWKYGTYHTEDTNRGPERLFMPVWHGALYKWTDSSAADSGTATAGAATTLTDSGKSWGVNDWAGFVVAITGGTGSGQYRGISSNTATELTVPTSWTTNPDTSSTYAIYSNARVEHLHVTNLTSSPRLYAFVRTSSTTLQVYHMVLPRTTNPADDPDYQFNTTDTGEVYFPRWTGNFPFENKLLKGVGVGGRNLASGRSVGAQYKVASATSYTAIGTTTTEGGERLAPSGNPTAAAFDLKATLSTSVATATPVLSSFVVYTALRTNTGLKDITATIRIRDGVVDRRGQPLRASWENLRDDIEAAITTNGTINVITPKGETVTVIGVSFSEARLGEDSDGAQIWTMTIRMIQTRIAYSRGTWSRAGAYTWGALGALTWGDVAVI